MESKGIQQLPIERITVAPQVRGRFDEESIAGLAQTFAEVGFLQPISVRRSGDRWIVTDGERRLRAAKLAGMKSVPVIIEERELSNAEVIQRQLVANCQREELSGVEKAVAIDQLMQETQWSVAQVAVKLGFSPATVSRLLSLLTLPEDVQAKVAAGAISASAAYELARVKDPESQSQLVAEATSGLTRDGLAGKVRTARRSAQAPAKCGPARVTAILGPGRAVTVCGTGLTLESFIEWLQELLDKARKVRPKGLELDTFLKMLRDQAKTTAVRSSEAR